MVNFLKIDERELLSAPDTSSLPGCLDGISIESGWDSLLGYSYSIFRAQFAAIIRMRAEGFEVLATTGVEDEPVHAHFVPTFVELCDLCRTARDARKTGDLVFGDQWIMLSLYGGNPDDRHLLACFRAATALEFQNRSSRLLTSRRPQDRWAPLSNHNHHLCAFGAQLKTFRQVEHEFRRHSGAHQSEDDNQERKPK